MSALVVADSQANERHTMALLRLEHKEVWVQSLSPQGTAWCPQQSSSLTSISSDSDTSWSLTARYAKAAEEGRIARIDVARKPGPDPSPSPSPTSTGLFTRSMSP